MSEIEYYSRKLKNSKIFSLCKSPFTGLYIGPQGHIVLCCMSQNHRLEHIDDIEDLEEFYNGPKVENIRKQLEAGDYATMYPCRVCYQRECRDLHPMKKLMEGSQTYENFDEDWKKRKEGKNRPIRYLEYTLSNLCNATCATCRSEWSSLWAPLDKKFGRKVTPIAKLSESAIPKIEKILYGLERICIKGGEPFADVRNLRILKKLFEVNPNCIVSIVSNCQTITKEAMDILKMGKNINLQASIDGVGKTYEWIRSGNWERTCNTMKRYHEETGNSIHVITFTSLYNFFILDQIDDFFKDFKPVWCNTFNNYAVHPHYVRPDLLPEHIFNKQMEKLKKVLRKQPDVISHSLLKQKWEDLGKDKELAEHYYIGTPEKNRYFFFKEMDKMNKHRGFDLCDHIPELKDWRDGRF